MSVHRKYTALLSSLTLLLSLTPAAHATAADADFQARCNGAGVIACEGFDDPAEFVRTPDGTTGMHSNGNTPLLMVQDTTIKSSGNGSLLFPIKANDGTGPTVRSNNWIQMFCSSLPPNTCTPMIFGPNSTFYVQFRYRVDTAYATTNWEDPTNGGSSPKIADFAWSAPVGSSSCGQTEITTNNRNASDMPMMYTSCGAHAFSTVPGTTNWADTNTPYSWQSGYYNCSYPFTPSGPGGCFKMPPNTWMTFYYSIQLGGAGQPNSHITAWVGPDGQLLQKFMDVTNMPINFDEPGYNAIYFNVYMTGFNGAATNPAANAWLDEVIVSTQPIAAPAVNSGTPPPPSSCDVNGDGQINVADVQLEVNMALGISTCANPSGTCTVASVQRVVNAALGGTCVSP